MGYVRPGLPPGRVVRLDGAQVRRALGRSERGLSITVLARQAEAAEWLATQPHVTRVDSAADRISLTYAGSQEEQADLLGGLFRHGFRVTVCEERRSSFEDILITVAEENL